MRRQSNGTEKEARKCHCDLHKAIPSVPRLAVRQLNRSRPNVAAELPSCVLAGGDTNKRPNRRGYPVRSLGEGRLTGPRCVNACRAGRPQAVIVWTRLAT